MPFLELDVLNNAQEPILGIDLGTTNSLAALWIDGRPRVLVPPGQGDDGRIPSAIHFPAGEEPVVGRQARRLALEDPHRTVFSVKRLMGRGKADVADELRSLPFRSVENDNGLLQLEIDGRRLSPQELSALILREVHARASDALGEPAPKRVVVTVPAYFDDTQRQATRNAARLAGLEVLRIVNEPTAASLAYGLDQRKEGNVVVYDLGGGTFDVSVLSIEDGVFRVLATAGDTHLGGDDLDRALVDLVRSELAERLDAERLDDPAFQQALKLAAERCKIELSQRPEADLHVVAPELRINWRHTVTRAELDGLAEPWIARTLDACRRALADAGLGVDAIDEVVLVGGSTRVPLVRERIEAFFGRKAHAELDPDQVVALGAAVQGHVLAGGTRDILLLDVTPLSLGVETMGGAVDKVIQRNAPVPCSSTQGYTTYADDQTGIDFHVVQGERELAEDCRSLGRFQLRGIPPMPAGLPKVAVRFSLDADGILTVTAREESTGQEASIEVQPLHGLTDDEVETMLRESYEHAREDFDRSRVANLKVEIGTMLRACEAHLDSVRDELDAETVADLEEAMAGARSARDSDDPKAVQAARDELERATLPLAALLMDEVAKRALAGRSLDEI